MNTKLGGAAGLLVSLCTIACGPDLREGAHTYACLGENLVSEGPIPCRVRVCADDRFEAMDVAGRACAYSVLSCDLIEENACRLGAGVSGAGDALVENLMATEPDHNIEGTIDTTLSWIDVNWDGTSASASIAPASKISLHDDGGEDTAGRVVVTNMETWGNDTTLGDHGVANPTVLNAQFFAGFKAASGDFWLRPDTILFASWAQIDGHHTSVMGHPAGIATGTIDYALGEIEIDGVMQGSAESGPVPLTATYHLVYRFEPEPVPTAIVDVVFGQNYASISEFLTPNGPITDVSWYAGDVLAEVGFLDEQQVVGHSVGLDTSGIGANAVTLYLRDEAGVASVQVVCLSEDETDCLPPCPPEDQECYGAASPGPSCASACGGASDGCWCDDACSSYGDCCDDYAAECNPNSCWGSCDARAPGGCWCDAACSSYGDCCADKALICDP